MTKTLLVLICMVVLLTWQHDDTSIAGGSCEGLSWPCRDVIGENVGFGE